MTSLCWGLVPRGCVQLVLRHEAGLGGFENVTAFVAENTTVAQDTMASTMHYCLYNPTDQHWDADNKSVAVAYEDVMKPISDLQWVWMLVAPAIALFLLLATCVMNSLNVCTGTQQACTPPTLAMLWCPWWIRESAVVSNDN